MTSCFSKVDHPFAATAEGFVYAGMQAFVTIIEYAHQHGQVVAGVNLHMFDPRPRVLGLRTNLFRRLHRKLCVVDGEVAFCGGINILDDFIDPNVPGGLQLPRLDYAVSLRGPLVDKVHDAMTQLWSRIEAVRELRSQDIAGALDALRTAEQDLKLPTRGTVQLV
eukprot:gene14532-17746_t